MTEEKIWELFVTKEHIGLIALIFAIIMLLKWIKPINAFLFSDKWKWLIAPINLVLSGLGVFLLGLTTFTTVGMKIVILIVSSTVVTFSYEAALKYLINFITSKVQAKLNKNST
jgi:hypothetical protein